MAGDVPLPSTGRETDKGRIRIRIRIRSGLESRRFGRNPRPSAGERVESTGSGRGWGGCFFRQ